MHCEYGDCAQPVLVRGLCRRHHSMWKAGTLDHQPSRWRGRTCTLCNRQHYGNGFCIHHNRRWRKFGDPNHLLPREHPCPEGMRICTKCKSVVPMARFSTDRMGPGGRASHCKPCKSKDAAARQLSMRRNDGDAVRAKMRAAHARNPERMRCAVKLREAKKRTSVATLTLSEWLEVLEYFGHRCAYCLRTLAESPLTQDHVIPVVRGGAHSSDNVVPACRSCNSCKSDRPVWSVVSRCG